MAASGNLRGLYQKLRSYQGEHPWEEAILPLWTELEQVRQFYESVRDRPCTDNPWPELKKIEGWKVNSLSKFVLESWDFYSASRLSDLMLTLIPLPGGEPVPRPALALQNYQEFFAHLGFHCVEPDRFHPFYCEVVEVVESNDQAPAVVELYWPAVMLGNMMFQRAGVKLRAPRHRYAKGVADRSVLYWSHLRRHRPCTDLSVGWGHNSQWATQLRRDFDLGDRYVYNVDKTQRTVDLRKLLKDDSHMPGVTQQERIDFLRHRCVTGPTQFAYVSQDDFFPYNDYFEEAKLDDS